jgi:hypothetical protein
MDLMDIMNETSTTIDPKFFNLFIVISKQFNWSVKPYEKGN